MVPDTALQLGDFEFASAEVPEQVSFGGSQRISVKEFIGGKRTLDCMGRSDLPLEWSGIFTGPDAVARAQYLDFLRVGGLKQAVSWGQFRYTVVVRDFKADYFRYYRVPYHITCEVVSDDTHPISDAPPPAIDAALQDDMDGANGLGDAIGDGPLSALLGGLGTAIGAVSSFANAAQSTINSVLTPLAAVQQRVSTLITASGLTLQNVSTFGGVLPNTPFSQAPLNLISQTATMVDCNNLFCLRNVLGRMNANLVSVNSPQKRLPTVGGNLFQVAQAQYGDATAWTAIAKANGVTDPFVQGATSLAIPGRPGSSGGVLSA